MVSRFGSDAPEHRENAAKMLATFLLTMRGTPFWLAGDEIGMSNIRFENIDDYNDIDTRNRYLQIRKEGGDPKAFLEEQKQTGPRRLPERLSNGTAANGRDSPQECLG